MSAVAVSIQHGKQKSKIALYKGLETEECRSVLSCMFNLSANADVVGFLCEVSITVTRRCGAHWETLGWIDGLVMSQRPGFVFLWLTSPISFKLCCFICRMASLFLSLLPARTLDVSPLNPQSLC